MAKHEPRYEGGDPANPPLSQEQKALVKAIAESFALAVQEAKEETLTSITGQVSKEAEAAAKQYSEIKDSLLTLFERNIVTGGTNV
jgi:hypothetical protein